MSVCLLMIGVPVHAENTDLDVETVQEEATVDIEEVQNEGLPSDGEAEQNEEVPSDGEAEQNEEVSSDGEAEQNEEVSSDGETEQNEGVSLIEETDQNGAVSSDGEADVSLADENSVQRSNGLGLKVEIPSEIKCGEPLTFRLIATGGSGNYKYRWHTLWDSEKTSVYDVSYGSNGYYQDNNEFPFTFYASGKYYIRFSVMDMNTKNTVSTGMFEYSIDIQDARYPSVDQIVNDLAAECQQECSTDFDKALWMHDWILDNAVYDESFSYCSAEGVLARGEGTCESYHRAYEKLLNKVGIQTGRITGNGHVWTAVKMDGKWYQVDSTWDDTGTYKEYEKHLYFGLTDDIMGLVHPDHKAAVPGYESTSLENNYFIKKGEIREWSDPLTAMIKQKIAAGEKGFALAITDSMPDAYKDVIYNLAAYQLSQDKWGDNISLSASYSNNQVFCLVSDITRPITSVSLNKPQLSLTEGGSSTLTAAIMPTDTTENKTVRWSSSNTKVATVSGGKVTAVAAGEATITVKTVNGKSASCKVTVTKKAKPITSVSLNKSQLTLTEGGSSTLTATIAPTDTTQSKTLSWSSSNTKVAKVSGGKVTAVTAGKATITVKTVNGKSASCIVTVNKKETSTPKPPEDSGENQNNTPPRTFPDVKSTDWYQESVDFVSSREIMTGMGDGRFAPSKKLVRAQFATILHRMAGTPEPMYNMEMFPDVPDGQFYTKASIWAREVGVITGYNDGRFGPSDDITREQMAVMMYRYANVLQKDVSERGNLWDFPDASKVSGFAWDALGWAVGNGLITGDQGRLNPGGTANRAECATIIMRFMNAYGL